ncbi:SH3 domain-binding glutamic acid-rich-like protein 3 isoform X1 [Buteo buteo]|uniref:SH3 domain-binding glutamic acid-rich-like protein 3 isoform X1 n=1 Tax=Buteo buteo TaxID=30397 RepID=UPI003EBAA85B
MGRECSSVCWAAGCLSCSFRIWCITFLAVSVPRLLLPRTELNVGQGYFLKSFVLTAGSSLGAEVQNSTSCENCSLLQIKSQQSEVTRILDGKNIKYELVDISQDNALREEMRAKAGNPKAIPPQIVNGDQYCGDYELFVEAVEQNTLQEFLKLA